MTTNDTTITEAEFHAFCDGELGEEDGARVAAAIEADPTLRARMARMMGDIAAMRRAAEPSEPDAATEALASRLGNAVEKRERQQEMARLGMGLAASVAMVAGGWFGHVAYMHNDTVVDRERSMVMAALENDSVPSFVANAAGAHEVFAPDTFHPVEFTARDEVAMANWFTERLGEAAMVPHLEELGFNLVGGRLLAGADGPMAQVMYENDNGDRVSLVYGRQQVPGDDELRLVHVGKTYASYWQEGGFAWAVLEDSPGADVSVVATHVSRMTKP
ncbi:MAG: anti-sigma factor [Pseudomonadota bacterium]